MKFITLPTFESDYNKLSTEERAKFRKVVKAFIAASNRWEDDPENFSWPSSLRFEKLTGTKGVFAITWSFAGPDGRATFSFQRINDERYVVWRRVGRHDIYRSP